METFSMLITTAPLIVPIVAALDLGIGDSHTVRIWFGILLTVLLETALITPPIGVNLYVVQGVRGRGTMNDVIVGTLPFVATMFVMIVLLVYFPTIALWLPKQFY
jgi:TRAP-type C4-dicarboxylate transport system permease large subunit